MRHVVYKLFSIGAFEKEEKWLNEMSAKGMQLVRVEFCRYEFEQGIPNEYVYRSELFDSLPSSAESVRDKLETPLKSLSEGTSAIG